MLAATVVCPLSFTPGVTWSPGITRTRPCVAHPVFTPIMMAEGDAADLKKLDNMDWSRAATTDDGACFVVEEGKSPDPSKQWFFCNDPAVEDSMECRLVPEWMGESPSGDHAVW